MKKRSLVAALAMLMVSAIVLTSSTYAWFATGTTAKVSGISATVSNSSGNITISANGTDYATTLDFATDFQGVTGNLTPANFQPVSFNPEALTFVAGSIAQGEDSGNVATFGKLVFNPALATGDSDKYIQLKVYVKSSVDCSVTVAADMAGSVYQFIYAAIYDDAEGTADYKVYNTASRTYTPVVSATAGIDVDTDNIMTSKDKLTDGASEYNALGNAVNSVDGAGENETVTLNLKANTPQTITLYVWAEGNDSLCVGNIASQACAVALNFTKV